MLYVVTGNIRLTGSKSVPKAVCKDRIIGTWKTAKRGEIALLRNGDDKENKRLNLR